MGEKSHSVNRSDKQNYLNWRCPQGWCVTYIYILLIIPVELSIKASFRFLERSTIILESQQKLTFYNIGAVTNVIFRYLLSNLSPLQTVNLRCFCSYKILFLSFQTVGINSFKHKGVDCLPLSSLIKLSLSVSLKVLAGLLVLFDKVFRTLQLTDSNFLPLCRLVQIICST